MRKLLVLCSLLIVGLSACRKNSEDDYAAQQAVVDDNILKNYFAGMSIVATKDPSGIYYAVITPGTGAYPTSTSTVNVNYTGKFTDETVFDSGNITTRVDGNIIEGWKIGLPKINKGGRLLLGVPSALAYGQRGRGTIPANKVLIFSIDMLSIQ